MSILDSGHVERMLADVAGLGDQLRQSARAADGLPPLRRPDAVCVAALGGSAIGADLAEALWGRIARVPVVVRRDGELPGFVGRESLVLAMSYSGETVETLSCARAALQRGARLVAITGGGSLAALARESGSCLVPLHGGLPPRVALGHLFAAVAGTLQAADVIPDVGRDIEEAADACDAVAANQGGELARRLGTELASCTSWIAGAGPLAAVARRWKTQLNENAKAHALFGTLPEADHNEIVGWAGAPRSGGRHAAVLLSDPEDPPRVTAGIGITLELIENDAQVREVVSGEGQSRAARAFWLVSLGDHVATYAAEAAGVDPYDIDRLVEMKARLRAADRG